jgi:hypothetical protein
MEVSNVLVLQRNVGQPVRLVLGGVVVWVMIGRHEITGKQQLLVEAPPGVEIARDEVLPADERMACHPAAHRFRHLLSGPVVGRAAAAPRACALTALRKEAALAVLKADDAGEARTLLGGLLRAIDRESSAT